MLWNVWWSFCGVQSVWEGEGPKTLLSYFWVADPSPSSKSVFALFLLKEQLPHSVSLALLSLLLSVFWHLLSLFRLCSWSWCWPIGWGRTHWQLALTVMVAVRLHRWNWSLGVPQVHVWSVKCPGEQHENVQIEHLGEMRWVNRLKSVFKGLSWNQSVLLISCTVQAKFGFKGLFYWISYNI